jgi:hypothetical protein
MAFDLTNLSAYTDQHSFELISEAVAGAKIMKYANVRPGYGSGTVAINLLNSTINPATAATGFSVSGSTQFDQVTVTTVDKQVKESFDVEALRSYWMSTQLSPAGQLEEIPFGQQIAELKAKQIQKYVEEIIMTGDSGNLKGMKVDISVASGSKTYVSASALTVSNAIGQMTSMSAAIPNTVADASDLTAYMSYGSFRAYNQALVAANLYHYTPGFDAGTSPEDQYVIIPGTNVKAVPFSGLGTSNRIFIGPASDLVITVGLTDDFDNYNWKNKPYKVLHIF